MEYPWNLPPKFSIIEDWIHPVRKTNPLQALSGCLIFKLVSKIQIKIEDAAPQDVLLYWFWSSLINALFAMLQ